MSCTTSSTTLTQAETSYLVSSFSESARAIDALGKEIQRLKKEVETADKRARAYQQGSKQIQQQRDALLLELEKLEQETEISKADAWDEGRRDAADQCGEDCFARGEVDLSDYLSETILRMPNPYMNEYMDEMEY